MGVHDVVQAAVNTHLVIREFAVTHPVEWTAIWQVAGIVGTLFLPAWGRPLLNQALSYLDSMKNRPGFDKEKAENLHEMTLQDLEKEKGDG